ncbi:hypothetical protein HBB16_16905 [Pseudonocardia sp. MCCB 268]|nr:hypothetical protein [Pseudonocardia cytotoxica]
MHLARRHGVEPEFFDGVEAGNEQLGIDGCQGDSAGRWRSQRNGCSPGLRGPVTAGRGRAGGVPRHHASFVDGG